MVSVRVGEDQENKDVYIGFPPVTILSTFGRRSIIIIRHHHSIDKHQQVPYSGEDERVNEQQKRL